MTFQLPVLKEPPSSLSMQELTEALQKKIDLCRSSEKSSPRLPTMATIPEPLHYTSRTLSNAISAVEICPAYPDYMIIGTYALLKSGDPEKFVGQIRTGSISIVPLATSFKPAYPGQVAPFLDEKCLDAAVLDLHFHPSDNTFLGVATSDSKVTFFRLRKRADVLARKVEMQLLHLGSIEVGESNEHGEIPLITSFCWMPEFNTREETGRPKVDDYQTLSFAASLSNGDVKWVSAVIPTTYTAKEARPNSDLTGITTASMERHTEEAWTVAATTISTTYNSTGDVKRILVLSGGDDSALNATSGNMTLSVDHTASAETANRAPSSGEDFYKPDLAQNTPSLHKFAPQHLWTDRKTHTAGVVAILPLPAPPGPSSDPTPIPVLTGSYDEHIRLFLLDATSPTLKRSLVLENKLNGGVWRLKLMHSSSTTKTTPSSSSSTKENTNTSPTYSALILASCMHAGVRILRLTYTPPSSPPATPCSASHHHGWDITVLAKFSKGHESMNYASDFRAERDGDGRRTGEYTVVSTSFYDKAVCVWRFVDEGGL